MLGSSVNTGQVMRRSGPRQGTSVHVHIVVDVEQFCHKLIPPFLQRRLTCGAGVASFLTPWFAEGEVPTGVNLNRYAGKGSRIPRLCDHEHLFGHPNEPKVIVSTSLGHSVLFTSSRAGEYTLSNSVGSW